MKKTNAVRILDQHKINYELIEYQVTEDDLTAITVAKKLGQNIDQVFKTLVLRGDKTGVLVAIIPGDNELSLKKTAKLSGNKKVEMVPMKELLNLTGYIRGGCTAIGMKKTFPTYIHSSCLSFESIFISAGVRGMQIKIEPLAFIHLMKIEVGELID